MTHIHTTADRYPETDWNQIVVYQRPYQIILVEDDAEYARALTRRFSRSRLARYRVLWLSDLDALLARLEVRKPDAILLDLNLLDSRGASTLAYACTVARLVPILALTADEDPALADLARREGVQSYLVKSAHGFPSIERAVLSAIRRARWNRYADRGRRRDEQL